MSSALRRGLAMFAGFVKLLAAQHAVSAFLTVHAALTLPQIEIR
jgi:hypothetical protein